MKRIVLSIVVLLVLLCGIAVAEEVTIVASGNCGASGSNVKWTLDSEGTLTISGTGKMKDYYWSNNIPWYSNRESIKTAVIENDVTSIGYCAFYNCSSLSSIAIPDGVTSIGDCAFGGCSSLSSITLPEGVTSIGNYTFDGCSSLSSITIPEDVTSIGDWAFEYCSSLTSIDLPAGVTSIGEYAFYNCSNLGSITLPEGVTSIGNSAFRDCSSLSSITIPDGVTSIGYSAFVGCSKLGSITIPAGVTKIDGYTFSGCSSLSSITIPEGVTSIGEYAFESCSSLSSISLPEGVKSIGEYAFYNCSSLSSIGNSAFSWCSSLSSITLPAGLTSIGNSAFDYCSSLYSIVFRGRNMPSLGINAIPDPPTIYCHKGSEVDDWAMTNGYTIVYLEDHTHTRVIDPAVPETHVTAGLTEGSHCSVCGEVLVAQQSVPIVEVEKVVLPAELEVIEAEAFAGDRMACVVLPEGCKEIGAGAFKNCAQLRFIEIPASVTSIDETAFDGCGEGLIIVTTSESVAEDFANRNGITCVTH